ncbi:hypothetical protein ACH4VR_36335 [Streptomyces sp. NPDC020883]|uniref:hypothetical protein n=1 Tax=Streptomyces sp. NPDC020883 TaxID=3365099 RepID=UPI00379702D8
MSQRTVSEWSGVSAGTLKNLARIGLLPDADGLRPHDVVLARVASALGATRSTNRDTQQGERTTTAFQRDWDAVRVVMELLVAADDPASQPDASKVHPRTRLVAFPEHVALVQKDYELLELSEKALTEQWPYHVLPIGAWHAELMARLAGAFNEEAQIAA